MSSPPKTTASPAVANGPVPPLVHGERLSRQEFERRYSAMPELKKAELIEGVVYLPQRDTKKYATSRFEIIGWLGAYCVRTAGLEGSANASVRLDFENEPQPDAVVRITSDAGG